MNDLGLCVEEMGLKISVKGFTVYTFADFLFKNAYFMMAEKIETMFYIVTSASNSSVAQCVQLFTSQTFQTFCCCLSFVNSVKFSVQIVKFQITRAIKWKEFQSCFAFDLRIK